MARITQEEVDKILDKNKRLLEAQLALNATKTTADTLKGYAVAEARRDIADVTKSYIEQYKKGGSFCPDPNNLGKAIRVNWIDKSYASAKDDIVKYLDGYDGSKSIKQVTKDLQNIIDTDIDARRVIRTETEKIRTAAKMQNMRANGAEYVRYVAVMDDRVRPEHAALDGQVFPIDEAPILGEPNCRCTYVQATEKEYEADKTEYNGEDWNADKAQEWLKSPHGIMIGTKNATNAAKTVEEKRSLFLDFFSKESNPALRMEYVARIAQQYKPDWCKIPLSELIDIPAKLIRPYEAAQVETTKVLNNDAPVLLYDKEALAWNEVALKEFESDLALADKGVLSDFPILRKYTKAVKPMDVAPSATSITNADYDNALHFIRVNTNRHYTREYLDKYNRETLYEVKAGKEVRKLKGNAADGAYTLQHELGHAVKNLFETYHNVIDDSMKFWTEFNKIHPEYKMGKKGFTKQFRAKYGVSKYGTTEGRKPDDEFVAECFCDFYGNGANAAQISKDVVSTYKQLLTGINEERVLKLTQIGSTRAYNEFRYYYSNNGHSWLDYSDELKKYAEGKEYKKEVVDKYFELMRKEPQYRSETFKEMFRKAGIDWDESELMKLMGKDDAILEMFVKDEDKAVSMLKEALNAGKVASETAVPAAVKALPKAQREIGIALCKKANKVERLEDLLANIVIISDISTFLGLGKGSVNMMKTGESEDLVEAYIGGITSNIEISFLTMWFRLKGISNIITPKKGMLKNAMLKHYRLKNTNPNALSRESYEMMESLQKYIKSDGREL